ncbi:LysR family transcriptional regulator [Herbaspirillum lusitanum]|uniref:LysR family transcriptional regulator n=1 Tax=Herbaspirillum lusitanum TaxID=213312 RepID=UPI000380992E|nr:LysR family transcriptional regulator [Herbaspirillum lusitanum]
MIKELKTLIAVAREGTFAAAGNKIGLTQAAVSAQMQRLESEIGQPLFERDGRTLRLNSIGRDVLAQAQELILRYDNLGRTTDGLGTTRLITIGAIASMQRSLLPGALAAFYQKIPDCRTRVIPGLSMELLNLVDAGEIDLAAVIRPPFSLQRDLHWTTLASEPFRLIVPNTVKGDDWQEILSTHPFIRYDRASYGGRQVDRFLRSKLFTPNERCEVDELDAIVKLVANDVGIALVPETSGHQQWPTGVRAIQLGEHTFHRDIGLVHRAWKTSSEPARQLAELIMNGAKS